jgi:hypothetical protein
LASRASGLQQCDKIRVWGPSLPPRNGHESIIEETPISGAGGLRKRSGPCSSRKRAKIVYHSLAETKNEHLVRAGLQNGAASFAFVVRMDRDQCSSDTSRRHFFSLICGNGVEGPETRRIRALREAGANWKPPKADTFSGDKTAVTLNPCAALPLGSDGGSVAHHHLLFGRG